VDFPSSYNEYAALPDLVPNTLRYLFESDEDIWKLLKYSSVDALSKPNLTLAEKRALIYDGLGEQDKFRIFRQPFMEDVFNEQVCQLRVYSTQISPTNRILGVVDICFELLCHNKIITLQGGQYNRMEVMVQRLIQALNGQDIGGVGKMFFDQQGQFSNRVTLTIYNNRNYVGYRAVFSVRVGAEDV